ncbi:MAG: hypothetical protein Q7S55_04755 [Nanoarchaeota archaeon]|nr:hypothetical protein [Nanoarchaeota archaeon]
MTLEYLLSYANANDMGADEVKAKACDKLRNEFLRGVCYEYITTYLDATGLKLMGDLKLSEEEVHGWYSNLGNIWHVKEMEKLTGIRPKPELIDELFYMTEDLAKNGMDQWRRYINHFGVKPSPEKTWKAYEFVLDDNSHISDFKVLGEIAELTGVKIPENLVQAKYLRIVERIPTAKKYEDVQDAYYAAKDIKRLFKATEIKAKLPEDIVQSVYGMILRESELTFMGAQAMEGLYEVTDISLNIPDIKTQEIFKRLLAEGNSENIGILKKISQTEPEFSYEDVQKAYSAAVGTHFDTIKRLRAIKDLTGIDPSEKVAIEGYSKHTSCCFSGSTDFISVWKEISGVSMPEEMAHKYIGILLKRT